MNLRKKLKAFEWWLRSNKPSDSLIIAEMPLKVPTGAELLEDLKNYGYRKNEITKHSFKWVYTGQKQTFSQLIDDIRRKANDTEN